MEKKGDRRESKIIKEKMRERQEKIKKREIKKVKDGKEAEIFEKK